ncbi:MAG: hypothetical protein IKH45_06285 [Neisseriaceae bacterium]|nr:hypothetical protein [Neisseriaceae bacterium]MBR3482478.1 hypothetical protein [Neisseriaceae bacterium]
MEKLFVYLQTLSFNTPIDSILFYVFLFFCMVTIYSFIRFKKSEQDKYRKKKKQIFIMFLLLTLLSLFANILFFYAVFTAYMGV